MSKNVVPVTILLDARTNEDIEEWRQSMATRPSKRNLASVIVTKRVRRWKEKKEGQR